MNKLIEKIMKTLLDKQFDEDFKKVEFLTWYPWVGKNYSEAKVKILIIGKGQYSTDERGE